jgi:hypothetical protein
MGIREKRAILKHKRLRKIETTNIIALVGRTLEHGQVGKKVAARDRALRHLRWFAKRNRDGEQAWKNGCDDAGNGCRLRGRAGA